MEMGNGTPQIREQLMQVGLRVFRVEPVLTQAISESSIALGIGGHLLAAEAMPGLPVFRITIPLLKNIIITQRLAIPCDVSRINRQMESTEHLNERTMKIYYSDNIA